MSETTMDNVKRLILISTKFIIKRNYHMVCVYITIFYLFLFAQVLYFL